MNVLRLLRQRRWLLLAVVGAAALVVEVALLFAPEIMWEEIGLGLLAVELGVAIMFGGAWSTDRGLHSHFADRSILSALVLAQTSIGRSSG